MSVAAILLAAGAATRMRGVDKLTKPVGGVPLLRDRAAMMAGSQAAPLIVVLPSGHARRAEALRGVDHVAAHNPDAASGMASSITSGISDVPAQCSGALIMPADMPDVTAADINALIAAHTAAPTRIIRATDHSGTAGSPVLFPRHLFAALLALDGDQSGRAVLAAHKAQVDHVALPGTHATQDLDTPEAWAAWRMKKAVP